MLLMPEVPLPPWLMNSRTFMRFAEFLPLFLIYMLPTLMLIGLAYLVIEETMFARDKFPMKGKVRNFLATFFQYC